MKTIDAKVAQVLNDYSLAITAGASHGVSEGDTVVLYQVVTIKDPDTSEPLGEAKVTIGQLNVTEVHSAFSIATVPYERGSFADVVQGVSRKRVFRLAGERSRPSTGSVGAVPGQPVHVVLQTG